MTRVATLSAGAWDGICFTLASHPNMSGLLQQIQGDVIVARKAQDKLATLVLSTLLSETKNREIEVKRDLTDADIVEVVRRAIKRRKEASDAFRKGGRDEMADKEGREAVLLEQYLPPAVDPGEIREAVRLAMRGGAATMGAVMGKVSPQFKGRADGSVISAIVKDELAKPDA